MLPSPEQWMRLRSSPRSSAPPWKREDEIDRKWSGLRAAPAARSLSLATRRAGPLSDSPNGGTTSLRRTAHANARSKTHRKGWCNCYSESIETIVISGLFLGLQLDGCSSAQPTRSRRRTRRPAKECVQLLATCTSAGTRKSIYFVILGLKVSHNYV